MYKYREDQAGLGECSGFYILSMLVMNQHNANTGLLPFEFLISKAVGFLYTMKCCC